MSFDYVIVGSGLTGATLARQLTDAGRRVLVLERRSYIGGNVADERHASGILVGKHGPHYFRTSSQQVWQFVSRFAEFSSFAAIVKSKIDAALENWPIAASYLQRIAPGWRPTVAGQTNFEQAALCMMPPVVYESFVKGYTEKQWGVPARSLSAKLCKRFDVHLDDNPQLTPRARYQAMPIGGYSKMVERMLAGIAIETGVDYLASRAQFRPRKQTIFCGPIDEYFDFELGRLAYRSQQRQTKYVAKRWVQPCVQVNYPSVADGPHIRTIEWKHAMPREQAETIAGTVITTETPFTPTSSDQYEYPFPDDANASLYADYQQLAAQERGVIFCGRLGEYRYYDMDQAIGRAMMIASRLQQNSFAEAA